MWSVRERRVKVSGFGDLPCILYFPKCVCFWALYLILSTLKETELALFLPFCRLNN